MNEPTIKCGFRRACSSCSIQMQALLELKTRDHWQQRVETRLICDYDKWFCFTMVYIVTKPNLMSFEMQFSKPRDKLPGSRFRRRCSRHSKQPHCIDWLTRRSHKFRFHNSLASLHHHWQERRSPLCRQGTLLRDNNLCWM